MIKKAAAATGCVNYVEGNKCRCLDEKYCFGRCVFYKTQEEQEAQIKKVFVRLKRLPYELQLAIADKYYRGKTVWRENAKGKGE